MVGEGIESGTRSSQVIRPGRYVRVVLIVDEFCGGVRWGARGNLGRGYSESWKNVIELPL